MIAFVIGRSSFVCCTHIALPIPILDPVSFLFCCRFRRRQDNMPSAGAGISDLICKTEVFKSEVAINVAARIGVKAIAQIFGLLAIIDVEVNITMVVSLSERSSAHELKDHLALIRTRKEVRIHAEPLIDGPHFWLGLGSVNHGGMGRMRKAIRARLTGPQMCAGQGL